MKLRSILFTALCGACQPGDASVDGTSVDGKWQGDTHSALSANASAVEAVNLPAAMACGASATASVRMRNTGSATWTAQGGFKLGTVGDQDPLYLRDTRVYLDELAQVPPGASATFTFELTAPPSAGTAVTDWQMVREGVAWFGAVATQTVVVSCSGGPPPPPPPGGVVRICPGVEADASGRTGATNALQECLDRTPDHGTLELPPGTYRMDAQLLLNRPVTLTTAGAAGAEGCAGYTVPVGGGPGVPCAVLQAASDLYVANGFLVIAGAEVHLDHVVLDGNRAARLSSAAASGCRGGNNRVGFNATAQDCADCSFLYSASVHALCGSGFEWRGDGATVYGTTFAGNGDNASNNMWSDGLTLLRSDGAEIRNNLFDSNSDVDLICGGGRNAVLKDNLIRQTAQQVFAGLMLDNFNGSTPGDFAGAVVSGNVIECGAQRCDYGIVLGPHAWYPSANITGGTVTQNHVTGAKLGLLAEGAGTPAAPMRVYGNDASGSPSSARFLCGTRQSANVVIFHSTLDRAGETGGSAFEVHACP